MPQNIPIHETGDEIEIRIDGFRGGEGGTMRRTIRQLVNARLADSATEEHRHEQTLRPPPSEEDLERRRDGKITFHDFRRLLDWDDVVFLWNFDELTADSLPGCEVRVDSEGLTRADAPLVFSAEDHAREHILQLSLGEILGALLTLPEVDRSDVVETLHVSLRCPKGGPQGEFVITRVDVGKTTTRHLDLGATPATQPPTGA